MELKREERTQIRPEKNCDSLNYLYLLFSHIVSFIIRKRTRQTIIL